MVIRSLSNEVDLYLSIERATEIGSVLRLVRARLQLSAQDGFPSSLAEEGPLALSAFVAWSAVHARTRSRRAAAGRGDDHRARPNTGALEPASRPRLGGRRIREGNLLDRAISPDHTLQVLRHLADASPIYGVILPER
jgi:hypothetical protein